MRSCASAQRNRGPVGAGHVVDANDGGRRTAGVGNINPVGRIHGNADGTPERIGVTADDGRLRQRCPTRAGQIVHANDAAVPAIGDVNQAVGVERHRCRILRELTDTGPDAGRGHRPVGAVHIVHADQA